MFTRFPLRKLIIRHCSNAGNRWNCEQNQLRFVSLHMDKVLFMRWWRPGDNRYFVLIKYTNTTLPIDLMTRKRLQHYWPFVGNRSFSLLYTWTSCWKAVSFRWFKTTWRSCDIMRIGCLLCVQCVTFVRSFLYSIVCVIMLCWTSL